ncbi:MAG TPA: FAD:protein FMN transferase [Gemmatimonadota bacterium]|nr:FAD:protein FMN transferase [Gemmatimonadota bacterium]
MTMDDQSVWHPSRRELISLGIGAFVVSLPLVRWAGRRRLVRRSIPVMGTLAEVVVVHDDEHIAQTAIEAALDRLIWVDRTMSRFDPGSDVGRANRFAAREPVPIHAETATVLRAAKRWADRTDGEFDPCLGKAVELWSAGDRHSPPPTPEVQRFAGRRLYEGLEVGDYRGRDVVRFHEAEMAIDLGGIAKGHAVDLAVQALRDAGIEDGLVNAGGDVYALGRAEDGAPWEAGVRSPFAPTELLSTVRLSNRALATSGDYESYFDYHGRRYHHILDPVTAAPRLTSSHTITVAADLCVEADPAATACFGTPGEIAHRWLDDRTEIVHTA